MYTIVDRYYMTMKERLGASLQAVQPQWGPVLLQQESLERTCGVWQNQTGYVDEWMIPARDGILI
jgi:hypothetical protein